MDPSLAHSFLDAAKTFDWEAVELMLAQHPALINVQPCLRWSALHQAAFQPNLSMVLRLLQKRADPLLVTSTGESPLDLVCLNVTLGGGSVPMVLRQDLAHALALPASSPNVGGTAVAPAAAIADIHTVDSDGDQVNCDIVGSKEQS